jgi:diguanylate cyclase (GGDEF)-like protein
MILDRALARVRSKWPAGAAATATEDAAYRDALTGLLNYNGLLARGSCLNGTAGALIILDLDHFRKINTALDTAGGDRVLVEVARRIAMLAPVGAVTARTWIDEFAILLPRAIGLDARQFAARLAREIARPIDAGIEQLVVTISIGVAEPDAGEPLENQLRRAGSAMRHHREPERIHDAEPSLAVSPSGLRQRFTQERELRDGLVAGQLRLFYQPIVDLGTFAADEYEALLRWDHPVRGVLLPGDFLFDVSSESLLRDLGRWVLREACRQGRAWQDQHPDRSLTMAVNLSPSQIRDPNLPDTVAQILEETGFSPAALQLEISETITLDDVELAVDRIQALRALGVRLALDDFGAGNAGWTLLRRSQIDAIKLDQSYLASQALEGERHVRMVEALATFGTQLGMSVAIEGIERAEQAEAMRALGVHRAQGYFFAPPRSAAEIDAFSGRTLDQPAG